LQGTIMGLLMLEDPEIVAAVRSVKLEDIGYHPY
jgi:hypothetical protein